MERIFLTAIDILQLRHLKNIKIELSRDEMKHLILTFDIISTLFYGIWCYNKGDLAEKNGSPNRRTLVHYIEPESYIYSRKLLWNTTGMTLNSILPPASSAL